MAVHGGGYGSSRGWQALQASHAAGGKAVGFFVALTMIYGGHGLISIHVFNQSSRVADAVNPVSRGVVVL